MKEQTKKRGRGRPPGVTFGIQKHIFVDQKTSDQLEALAAKYGLSESAIMRMLIQSFAKHMLNGGK